MKTLSLIISISLLPFMVCCKKRSAVCYDEQLKQQYLNAICTADCPGVKGCDGKTYCNECQANSQGIRIK